MLTYMGGDVCESLDNPSMNGMPRKTIFTLECGDSQENQVIFGSHYKVHSK